MTDHGRSAEHVLLAGARCSCGAEHDRRGTGESGNDWFARHTAEQAALSELLWRHLTGQGWDGVEPGETQEIAAAVIAAGWRLSPGAGRSTMADTCRDCGAPWVAVRRGECSRCGSDAGPRSAEQAEPDYCPFKNRCEHPDCLLDVEQCGSALMASARSPMPALGVPVRRVRTPLSSGVEESQR